MPSIEHEPAALSAKIVTLAALTPEEREAKLEALPEVVRKMLATLLKSLD